MLRKREQLKRAYYKALVEEGECLSIYTVHNQEMEHCMHTRQMIC
jgi:hypothetical protein